MAGTGAAPKSPMERRRRNAPKRGEWTEILIPYRAKSWRPPTLPDRGQGRGHWSPRTRRAWESWWRDAASTQWGPADVDLLEHLADVYEIWVRKSGAIIAAEVRQVRDSLGLTPKGKQDRRWVVTGVEEKPTRGKKAAENLPANVTSISGYRKRLGA